MESLQEKALVELLFSEDRNNPVLKRLLSRRVAKYDTEQERQQAKLMS